MQTEEFFAKYDYFTEFSELKFEIYNNDFGGDVLTGNITAEDSAVLLTLFKNEMMAASTTVFSDTYYHINLYNKEDSVWEDIRIPDSFTETIEFLLGHVEGSDEIMLGKVEE
jgi:hypothetical protein